MISIVGYAKVSVESFRIDDNNCEARLDYILLPMKSRIWKNIQRKIVRIILFLVLSACNTTKNIPEGSYLLDDFNIRHDTENSTSYLKDFVWQQPNSGFLLLEKVRLGIYSMAGQDTAKWLDRALLKIGYPPVIFSNRQTAMSMDQLKRQLNNQGYLNAEVDTTLKIKGRKISVTYNLKGGIPYRIRNYTYTFSDTAMTGIINRNPVEPLLEKGDMFDLDMMERERLQTGNTIRNAGYFGFSKEYLFFKADTTLNSHEVDLFMDVYPLKNGRPHRRYKIDGITVISGESPSDTEADTTNINGIRIIRGKDNFLRNSTVVRNTHIKKGAYFSDNVLSKTYDAYNKMNAVKLTNIELSPSLKDSATLDATITLLPADMHKIKAGLTGTNAVGDFGIAPDLTYLHQNFFNGGEQFSIKLKGAYEFIAGGRNRDLLSRSYFEYGIESGLSFPMFLFPWLRESWREHPSASSSISIGLRNQHRHEYNRQFFNMTLAYDWSTYKDRLRSKLELIDITYVHMPWVSEQFDSIYLSSGNSMLAASYRDELISRTAYTLTLANGRNFSHLAPTYTLRGSVEVGGLLPRLANTLGWTKDEEWAKTIMGVDYAEYVKVSADYAPTFRFSKKHTLAYHVMLGLVFPYGNSPTVPYVKRFFAGGPYSIRGWSTSTLGPGSYNPFIFDDDRIDLLEHLGNMKLELSIENRMKISSLLEFAQFIDAGNVWTTQDYEGEASRFRFNKFYKEIAVAYGVGLRLDLGYLLLRNDFGIRAYDPVEDLSKRFVLFRPRLNRTAWHFGIGYPF